MRISNRRLFVFVLAAGLALSSVSFAFADTRTLPSETIVSFSADLTPNSDDSLRVNEKIVYDSGPSQHHGIYRDIHTVSAIGRQMEISDLSVTDDRGAPYPYQRIDSTDSVRIKIGDPSVTFSGRKTYVIHYRASDAASLGSSSDEVYWNVTGNNWSMPILAASAAIHIPASATPLQSSCYYGAPGSRSSCSTATSTSAYIFIAPSILGPSQQLTVALGFAKGYFLPYSNVLQYSGFDQGRLMTALGFLIPICTLIYLLVRRLPAVLSTHKRATIVPQYDVPDNLTPLEVAELANGVSSTSDISAEIIYLATQGYLTIKEKERMKIFGMAISNQKYELIRTKGAPESALANNFDRTLLTAIFTDSDGLVDLSSSDATSFPMLTLDIPKTVAVGLLEKGYYRAVGNMKSLAADFQLVFLYAAVGFLAYPMLAAVYPSLFAETVPVDFGIFASLIMIAIGKRFSSSLSPKGVEAKNYLLGLRLYLQIAEKDRLEFHNSPKHTPEQFEKLLPYAMVLGVSDIWAKEFENLYTQAPSWYVGYYPDNTFSAVAFNNSIGAFGSSISTTAAGSSGGGFAGGGGGGGGGGSW